MNDEADGDFQGVSWTEFRQDSSSDDSETQAASDDDDGKQSSFLNEHVSQELAHLCAKANNSCEYSANNEATLIPTSPQNCSPINVLYSNYISKIINIGGKLIHWEAIVQFLKSMGLELVVSTNNLNK